MENEEIVNKNEEVNKDQPKKKKRPKIYEITAENDIKFRGFLSYRHLRIIAWLCLAIAQIGVLLHFSGILNQNQQMFGLWPDILSNFSNLMAPLFLIAAFATVLVAKDGYRRLILMYGGLTIVMYLAFLIVFQHYLVGLFAVVLVDQSLSTAEAIVGLFSPNGFIAFNIFLDLFLCTLVTFFVNYTPKKYFQGKKIYLFRALVALPILYEIGSIILKILSSNNVIVLSPFVFPLLTTKAPVAFLVFVAMSLFVKFREMHFIKKGKTIDDYQAFLKTNTNSLHFSIALSVMILSAAIIDLILLISITAYFHDITPIPEGMDYDTFLTNLINSVISCGFGQTVTFVLIIPIVIFFDYTKTYKKSLIDIIIPIAGVALLAIIYIEGGFEVIRFFFLNNSKESDPSTQQTVKLLMSKLFKGSNKL